MRGKEVGSERRWKEVRKEEGKKGSKQKGGS